MRDEARFMRKKNQNNQVVNLDNEMQESVEEFDKKKYQN